MHHRQAAALDRGGQAWIHPGDSYEIAMTWAVAARLICQTP